MKISTTLWKLPHKPHLLNNRMWLYTHMLTHNTGNSLGEKRLSR